MGAYHQDVAEGSQNDANRVVLWVTGGSLVAHHSLHQKVTRDTDSGFLGKAAHPSCHMTNPTLECPLSKNSSKCSAAKYRHSEEVYENRAGNLYNGSCWSQKSIIALCNYKHSSSFLERKKKNNVSGLFILPCCYIMLYSDHLQPEWNYYVLDSDELAKQSLLSLWVQRNDHCNCFFLDCTSSFRQAIVLFS